MDMCLCHVTAWVNTWILVDCIKWLMTGGDRKPETPALNVVKLLQPEGIDDDLTFICFSCLFFYFSSQ